MRGFDSPDLIPSKRVGPFSVIGGGDYVEGPMDYMKKRGNKLVDKVCRGGDVVFNSCLAVAPVDPDGYPDVEIALLQRLMADYLAWKGGA